MTSTHDPEKLGGVGVAWRLQPSGGSRSAEWPTASSSGPRAVRARALPILVVEDNPADAELIRELLERPAELVLIAGSLREATHLIESQELEVIILDLGLPDGQGSNVARDVLSCATRTPVVVLTGAGDDALARECLRLGVEDYLRKDEITASSLRRSIDFALSRSRADELKADLEHSQRLSSLGRITADLAHEVSGPATIVMANLSLASEALAKLRELDGVGKLGEVAAHRTLVDTPARYLDELEDAMRGGLIGIERIAAIIDELRMFSRKDSGAIQAVDVEGICRSSCRLASSRIRRVAALHEEYGIVGTVRGRARPLTQVVLNLIENGLQAIEQKHARGRIWVRTRPMEGRVAIEVEDDGVGIPERALSRIFQPFFTTKGPERGTGLGLAICADIVSSIGGELRLESLEGTGTRAQVILSRAADSAPPRKETASSE
ncbi:MAG: response regulator [Deltaproteobacteria bacterium]|nr:response regulator [Deltaproteobacteria bacterium]